MCSPTISGSLAEATGWRQIMWLCVGIAGVIEILFLSSFSETYHPTILKRRAARKRKETGDDSYTTEYEEADRGTTSTLVQAMFRPAYIVWSSSMLQCLSLWGAIMFAFFYINSTSLPEILEVVYDFSPSKRGLSYLAWSKSSNDLYTLKLTLCRFGIRRLDPHLQSQHGQDIQRTWRTSWRFLS